MRFVPDGFEAFVNRQTRVHFAPLAGLPHISQVKLSATQIPHSRKGDFNGSGNSVREKSDIRGAEIEMSLIPLSVDVCYIIALRVFRLFYVRRLQVLLDQLLRLGRNLRFERLWNLGGSWLRQGRPRHLEKFAHIFCLFISLEKRIVLYPSQNQGVKNKWKSAGTEMRCGHFGGAILRQEDGNHAHDVSIQGTFAGECFLPGTGALNELSESKENPYFRPTGCTTLFFNAPRGGFLVTLLRAYSSPATIRTRLSPGYAKTPPIP